MLQRCEECKENPAQFSFNLVELGGMLHVCGECIEKADFDLGKLKVYKRRAKG